MMRHKKKSTLKCFLGSRSPSWVKTGEEGNHFFLCFLGCRCFLFFFFFDPLLF